MRSKPRSLSRSKFQHFRFDVPRPSGGVLLADLETRIALVRAAPCTSKVPGDCAEATWRSCARCRKLRDLRQAVRSHSNPVSQEVIVRHTIHTEFAIYVGNAEEMRSLRGRRQALRYALRQMQQERADRRRPRGWVDVPADGTVGTGTARAKVRDLLGKPGWKAEMLLNGWRVKPRTADPHIGLEIECGADQGDLAEALDRAGVALRSSLGSDGSVELRNGLELRACFRQADLDVVTAGLGRALATAGARVNRSCGLHVHIDCRRRDPVVVYRRLYAALRWLYAITSPSRRTNSYCRRNQDSRLDAQHGRYYAINGQAFSRYQTIEVRLHQGTTDATKIRMWVRLLLAIADGPDVQRVPRDLYGFARTYDLPLDLAAWIGARAQALGTYKHESLRLPGGAKEYRVGLGASDPEDREAETWPDDDYCCNDSECDCHNDDR
jgi:hypothetical protein